MGYSLTDTDGKTVTQGEANTADQQFSFTVNYPRLWWPHTHGEPYLYTLTLEVRQGAALLDSQQLKVGFRKVQHATLDENTGEVCFAFEINNR